MTLSMMGQLQLWWSWYFQRCVISMLSKMPETCNMCFTVEEIEFCVSCIICAILKMPCIRMGRVMKSLIGYCPKKLVCQFCNIIMNHMVKICVRKIVCNFENITCRSKINFKSHLCCTLNLVNDLHSQPWQILITDYITFILYHILFHIPIR